MLLFCKHKRQKFYIRFVGCFTYRFLKILHMFLWGFYIFGFKNSTYNCIRFSIIYIQVFWLHICFIWLNLACLFLYYRWQYTPFHPRKPGVIVLLYSGVSRLRKICVIKTQLSKKSIQLVRLNRCRFIYFYYFFFSVFYPCFFSSISRIKKPNNRPWQPN